MVFRTHYVSITKKLQKQYYHANVTQFGQTIHTQINKLTKIQKIIAQAQFTSLFFLFFVLPTKSHNSPLAITTIE